MGGRLQLREHVSETEAYVHTTGQAAKGEEVEKGKRRERSGKQDMRKSLPLGAGMSGIGCVPAYT